MSDIASLLCLKDFEHAFTISKRVDLMLTEFQQFSR